MCTIFYEEMVYVAVAKILPTPFLMDHDDNECHEREALTFHVTHRLCHPVFCFIGDKVGGNISTNGDDNVGGQTFCPEAGAIQLKKGIPYRQEIHHDCTYFP